MFDAIGQIFQGFIDFLQPILIPDWRALIDLLPIFLLIGVVGPLLSLLILGWVVYVLRQAALADPVRRAPAAARTPRRRRAGLSGRRAVLRVQPARLPSGHRRAAPNAAATSPSSARSAAPAARPGSTRAARAGSSCASTASCPRSDPPAHHLEAPPRPDAETAHDRPSVRRHRMETASQALFTAGTIILAFAFAATIGHAVMLANGRRSLAGALARAGARRRRAARLGGRRDRLVRRDARRRPRPPVLRTSPPRRRCPAPLAG